MTQDERVLLKTFTSETDAKIASNLLSANGIDSFIQSDNVAGLHPELSVSSGVKLFVHRESFELAIGLLEGAKEQSSPKQTNEAPQTSKKHKIRSQLMPLLVGLVIGVSIGFVSFKSYYTESDFVDVNNDGIRDRGYVYVNDFLEKISMDTNFDGIFDSFTEYFNEEDGEMSMDTNYDGSIDSWTTLKHEMTVEVKTDLDANGIPDMFYYYDGNMLSKTEIRPNNSDVIERLTTHRLDFTWSEFVDEDKDGTFDIRDDYDQFNNKIKTENLNEAVSY